MEYVSTHPVMRDYGASRAESNEVISRCPQSYSPMASCFGERPFDCAIVGPATFRLEGSGDSFRQTP